MNKSVVSPLLQTLFAVIFFVLATGCATQYKIHGTLGGKPGSHKVTEVVELGSKEQILYIDDLYRPLLSAGINRADLRNGSVIAGRIYCCGGEGTVETLNNAIVYVPPTIEVQVNDILEYVEGHGPDAEGLSQLNVALKVRHRNGVKAGICRWEPDNPKLWLRVLKCPWMEDEGWVKGSGLYPVWFKPAAK